MFNVSEDDRIKYYRSALLLLRHIENRKPTGRRFGPDADALWASFHGDLSFPERIDLLIKDANAEWSGSFGACGVFALRVSAEDDSFDPKWLSLDPVDASEIWHEIVKAPPASNTEEALAKVAKTWGLTISPMKIGSLDPSDRIAAVGSGAIVALAVAFENGTDLDWREQVVCVASSPGDRQLAAASAALLGATEAGPILFGIEEIDETHRFNRTFISDDASPDDKATAEYIIKEVSQ